MKELFLEELPTEYDDEQNVLTISDNMSKDGKKPIFVSITEQDTNTEICIGLSTQQGLQLIQKVSKILQKYQN